VSFGRGLVVAKLISTSAASRSAALRAMNPMPSAEQAERSFDLRLNTDSIRARLFGVWLQVGIDWIIAMVRG
jgi:hypothetical protein